MGLQRDTGEEILCEDTERRRPPESQEESSHQEHDGLATWSWTSQSQDQRKKIFCCFLSHPIYSILLWKSEQTQTAQKLQEEKYYIFKSCISCL